ncbi:hypothetical protein ACP70R_036502 [Stipagrostis hirtigluma subsp. patula]
MSMAALMQRFDIVDELCVSIDIPHEIDGYENFLRPPHKSGKCDSGGVRFPGQNFCP